MSRLDFLILLVLLIPFSIEAYTISGIILEKDSREPLPYCDVIITEIREGSFTNENGYFAIKIKEQGDYTIQVHRIGYKTKNYKISVSKSVENIRIYLVSESFRLKRTVVKGSRIKDKYDPNFSNIRIFTSEIRSIPNFIESDILNVLAMLPGATRKNDISSALYVRGGKPDQNLILLDGAVLFSPYHLGGIFSTFNTDAIKSVNFMPGGYPAEYGGRLSSVLDIATKEGRKDKYTGIFEIGLLSSKFFLEGPIWKKGSLFLSYRRTYFDIIVDAFTKTYNHFVDTTKKTDFIFPYYFHDFNGKGTYYIDNKTKIAVSGLYGEDIIHLDIPNSEDTTEGFTGKVRLLWSNRMVSGELSRIINPLNIVKFQTTYSSYLNIFDLGGLYNIDNEIHNFSTNIKYICNSFSNNSITLKGEFLRTKFIYKNRISLEEGIDSTENYSQRVFSSSVSVGDVIRIGEIFVINPGLRLNYFSESNRFFLSPRLNIKYLLQEDLSINTAYGYYSQNIATFKKSENIFSQFFGDLWFPVMAKYKEPRSMIFVTGLEYWFNKEYPLTLQLYTKKFYNILSFAYNSYSLDSLIAEDGLSTGFEILIRKDQGRITGWLGYTFSITEMQGADGWYYPENDQRHNIQLVGNYNFSKTFRMGFSLSCATGMPYTGPAGMYPDYVYMYDPINDNYNGFDQGVEQSDCGVVVVNGKYNTLRFQSYKKIDLSLSKDFHIFKMKSRISLSVINVLNFNNPIFYFYDTFTNPPTKHSIYLPIFPSISFRGEF